MNRNHNALPPSCQREDVMTTVEASQLPAARLYDTRQLAARNLFHTVTSSILSVAPGLNSPSSASSQPSIASRTFACASSIVSPCETQPGKAGTSAQKPPSSALWINTFNVTSPTYLSTTCATSPLSSAPCPLIPLSPSSFLLPTFEVSSVLSHFPISTFYFLLLKRWLG